MFHALVRNCTSLLPSERVFQLRATSACPVMPAKVGNNFGHARRDLKFFLHHRVILRSPCHRCGESCAGNFRACQFVRCFKASHSLDCCCEQQRHAEQVLWSWRRMNFSATRSLAWTQCLRRLAETSRIEDHRRPERVRCGSGSFGSAVAGASNTQGGQRCRSD